MPQHDANDSRQYKIKESKRMSAPEKLRSVIVALLLGPGLAAAADVETVASSEQPIPGQVTAAMEPDMAPPVLM